MADPTKRKQILVLAYLCEPERGSEKGAGWGIVRALQHFGDCTVITAPQSGSVLDSWLRDNPEATFKVEVVSEPGWSAPAMRHRVGEFLVYLAWQRRARVLARRLVAGGNFDVAFHASLSAFWLQSIATDLEIPSVWGPVGGAVTTPKKLRRLLGWRGVPDEAIDWLAVHVMSLLPSTRRTWREASVRIAQNAETVRRLPRRLRGDTTVLNHAVFHTVPSRTGPEMEHRSEAYVSWISPMESRKGPELAVRALAETSSSIRMVMVGDGPERARIEQVVDSLGLENRITFAGQVPHQRALEIVEGATVAVFTGMREEGGLALAEAMLLGTPVVVLANGGAATIARTATDPDCVSMVEPGSVSGTITAMAAAIDYQTGRSRAVPHDDRISLIDQESAVRQLMALVETAIAAGS